MQIEETHICAYCGEYAQYQLKNGKWCCKPNWSSCPSLRAKNSEAHMGKIAWNKGHQAWNKGLTKETNESVAKQAISQSISKKGKPGHPHSQKFKDDQRERALKCHFGGFHMRRGIDYNGIKLDSSYEVILAKDLDKNGIKWERCKRFPYYINGKLHYYTPDFYLPDYDIYLDPKNDFLIKKVNPNLGYNDLIKIKEVEKLNNIKVIILNKDSLSWDAIKSILGII